MSIILIVLITILSLIGGYLVGYMQEREGIKMDNDLLTMIDNAEQGTLASTVKEMLSDKYKDRFIAEYKQTYIRYSKLDTMLCKCKQNKIDFKLKSKVESLEKQRNILLDYLFILEERARQEGINVHVY